MTLALEARIAELEQRCEEYRALDETSDAVPFRLTSDLASLIYVGPQAERLLGIAQRHWLIPNFLQSRLADEDRVATLEQFRVVLEFDASHEVEFRLRRDDGQFVWVRCTMRSFESTAGTVLAGHLLDISLRRRLVSDDAQLQRLEAVGRLASGIAHEINTPLQFVGHSLEFLADAIEELVASARGDVVCSDLAELAADSVEALTHCNDGVARVSALVRSMQTFVHAPGRQRAPVDLHDAIRSAITISASEHKPVAEVELCFGDVPPVVCSAGEIGQVFLNLIVNAAHAVEDAVRGTRLRGRITISTQVDGDDVKVSIADTGGGIPESIRSKIFEPFFTSKEVGRGTGQGLPISRSVVERHGGTITFETELGRGSTFVVRLPLDTKATS